MKIKKITPLLLFVVLVTGTLVAQTKKPAAKTTQQPTATATADSDKDAQIQALKAEIEELKKQLGPKTPVATIKPGSAAVTGSLALEAGLVFNSGDVKPVSRLEFFLLKADPEALIRNRETFELFKNDTKAFDAKYGGGFPGLTDQKTFESWSFHEAVLYMGNPEIRPTFAVAATKAIVDNKVASTMTGFDGKGVFENVPVGDYYIFANYKIGKQTAIWRVPVTIKAGANKIILDNNNMN